LLSSVNAAEAVAKMIRYGANPELAVETVRVLECSIIPVDDLLGLRAGELYAITAKYGLSLADRICLALAERERLPVFTADRAWASLDIGVEIRLIR
jgi:PIN domain nuclease of toxin-antitoxin system